MQSRSGTLTISTVATVQCGGEPADGFARVQQVEVLNRDGAGEIWFTIDGSTPTVAGNDCYLIPAAVSAVKVDTAADGALTVKLISSVAAKYTVTVLP